MAGSKKKRGLKKKKSSAAAPVKETRATAPPGIFLRAQSSWSSFALATKPWHVTFEVIAIISIFALGVFCRLEDLSVWEKNKSYTFYDNKPIHTTFDAWFYLSLAQDLIDDTYTQPDEKRGVPHNPPRPVPPPLISVIAAAVVKATNISLCWVGAVLPAVFGPLLVIPLYMIGRFYGGVVCGLLACLVSVLYPFYITRSNLGRFDTDCLILPLSLGATYLFMQFSLLRTNRRYVYACSGLLLSGLFLWWWDQTPAAVAALAGLPLLAGLVFFYRPSFKEGLTFYSILLCVTIAVLLGTDPAMPFKIIQKLWLEFLYITKDQAGLFPNVGQTISEQSAPSFEQIVRNTTAGTLSLLFAAAGLVMLVWRRRTHILFLFPFFILSILALTTANRFILFLIPLVALGTGYATAGIWQFLKKARPLNSIVCIGIAILLCGPLYAINAQSARSPKEPGFMVQGMNRIREITPQNAVIWAWWDHGYALTYYARRATINDGSIHGGELTVFNAIPYATDSFRLAANFMQFYVTHGKPGMQRVYRQFNNEPDKGLQFLKDVLRNGPDAGRTLIEQAALKTDGNLNSTDMWLQFFFPSKTRPIYLICDHLLNRTSYWWYWFGTWDIAASDGTHPRFQPYENITIDKNSIRGKRGLRIDRATGTLINKSSRVPLAQIQLHSRTRSRMLNDYMRSGLRLEFNNKFRNGAIMDKNIAESVFSRLFIRMQSDLTYFKPVINSPPFFQLWEVTGDSFSD